jgi:hypothetical protein
MVILHQVDHSTSEYGYSFVFPPDDEASHWLELFVLSRSMTASQHDFILESNQNIQVDNPSRNEVF